MSFIKTTESHQRALRATVDGIGPEVAEILQSKGVDPRTWAAEIRARRTGRAPPGAAGRTSVPSEPDRRLTPPLFPEPHQ